MVNHSREHNSKVYAYLSAAQILPAGAQLVQLDLTLFDTLGEFNTTTHIFTARRGGFYYINALAQFRNPNAAIPQYLEVVSSAGSAHIWDIGYCTLPGAFNCLQASIVTELNPGDTVELHFQGTVGANATTLISGFGATILNICKLR